MDWLGIGLSLAVAAAVLFTLAEIFGGREE